MKRLIFTVIFLMFEAVLCNIGDFDLDSAEAAVEIKTITDDATGGDCATIGAWNSATRTCTIGSDGSYQIVVAASNLTVDGNGHALTGSGVGDHTNDAITISYQTGVTIKNFSLASFCYGVNLHYTNYSSVLNIASNNNLGAGISLSYAGNNTMAGNYINNSNSDTGICIGYASTNNVISNNTVVSADRGIYLHDHSDGNTISGNILMTNLNAVTLHDMDSHNIVRDNTIHTNTAALWLNNASNYNEITGNTVSSNSSGLYLSLSPSYNTVHHNNFLGNKNFQVSSDGTGTGNSFIGGSPAGGNYWSDYDSAGKGCVDADADGYCDAPYNFTGGSDTKPIMAQNAWQNCAAPTLSLSVPSAAYWGSFADFQNGELSIDWKITNDGDTSVQNLKLMANFNTNGVTTSSPMPIGMGNVGAKGGSSTVTLKSLVPPGVHAFHSRIFVEVDDFCGATHALPGSVPGP